MNTAKIEALAVSEWQREQQSKTRDLATQILDLKCELLSLSLQRIYLDSKIEEVEIQIQRLKGSK